MQTVSFKTDQGSVAINPDHVVTVKKHGKCGAEIHLSTGEVYTLDKYVGSVIYELENGGSRW